MKRSLYNDLLAWKQSPRRKPLLLRGARQVGKTWLINEFGSQEYGNYYYFNFENEPKLKSIFQSKLDPNQIVDYLSLHLGTKISEEDTLICFDEIQVCQEAITSLKYFQESANGFHIIAAGSLLGVSVGRSSSFPVGKVNFLKLYPLDFKEYLIAVKEDLLVEKIMNVSNQESFLNLIHDKLMQYLKMYLYIGGMPEPLNSFIENRDIKIVRDIQLEIVQSYEQDFAKYASEAQSVKISEIWKSIPFQLAKENKKFMYSNVKVKARSVEYESAITWLSDAGLVHIVNNLRTVKLPLSGYADYSKFKIYLLDVGLLGAMLNLSSNSILEPNKLFKEYYGAFMENYVCLELMKGGFENLFYWTSDRSAEVDFVFEKDQAIIPLEVKSGSNKNLKSLRVYESKYHPDKLLRSSPRNYMNSGNFENIPLYALMMLSTKLELEAGKQ